jgi:hypothetical protein
LEAKSKELYDLNKELGCLRSENSELKKGRIEAELE